VARLGWPIALLLGAVVSVLSPASAHAFDPATDRPSAAYAGVPSPRNWTQGGAVAPRAIEPDGTVTATTCYLLAADARPGKLWQSWTNERTGDWFYVFATAVGDAYDVSYYRPGRGTTVIADRIAPNLVQPLLPALIPAAEGSGSVFRVAATRIDLPADGTCGAPPDAGLVSAAFAVGLVWDRGSTAWSDAVVTVRQAVETAPSPVYFDGWAPVGAQPAQVELRPVPPPATTEQERQIDLALTVGMRRATNVVHALETAGLAALALLIAAPLGWRGRRRLWSGAESVWKSAGPEGARLRRAALDALMTDGVLHTAAVGVVCLAAVSVRLAFLDQPMRGDESVTYLNYASRGVWRSISSYDAPNNHVLHSVLVALSIDAFGDEPWAIRLPAFLAGILVVPATYVAGRQLYGRESGLLAAALAAGSSVLVEYATNARGYSVAALGVLMLLWLAAQQRHSPSPVGWAAFAVVAALGLFTVPTFLYALVVVLLWAATAVVRSDGHGALGWSLATATASAIGLSTLLYVPIMVLNGPQVLIGNEFVRAQSWDELIPAARDMISSAWMLASRDLPVGVPVVLAASAGAATVLLEPGRRHPAPLGVLLVAVAAVVVLVQRVAPPPRVWLPFLPLFFLVAASWAAPGVALLTRRGLPASSAASVLALALTVLLGASVWRSGSIFESTETGVLRDAPAIVEMIGAQVGPRDRVLEMTPSGAMLRYYLRKHGLTEASLSSDPRTSPRAIVVVNKRWGQTLGDVLRFWDLDATWIRDARLVQSYPSADIYQAVNPLP
jgi:hypothetical protein